MKIFRRILSIFLVIVLFASSFVGAALFFGRETEAGYDVSLLSSYNDEEGHFFLPEVSKKTEFHVIGIADVSSFYTLQDAEGNDIPVRIRQIRDGEYCILPPKNSYAEGAYYTLTLHSGAAFADESLAGIKKLTFRVTRPEVAEYTFTDKVIESDGIIRELEDGRITFTEEGVQPGSILFGMDENGRYVAHKITKILDDGSAIVEIPYLDEIYADINIHSRQVLDLSSLEDDPKFREELIHNIKKSNFFSSLVIPVYAADNIKQPGDIPLKVEFDWDEFNKMLHLKISIILEGGKEFFGVTIPENHEIIFTIKGSYRFESIIDFQKLAYWDLAFVTESEMHCSLDIRYAHDSAQELPDEVKEYIDFSAINELKEKLNQTIQAIKAREELKKAFEKIQKDPDAMELCLPIFDVPMPILLPGLNLNLEVELFAKLEIKANAHLEHTQHTETISGLLFSFPNFYPYSNLQIDEPKDSLSLQGKITAKEGIRAALAVCLVREKIFRVALQAEAGVYQELCSAFHISNIEEGIDLSGYLEMGIYCEGEAVSRLRLFKQDFSVSFELFEESRPFFQCGDSQLGIGLITKYNQIIGQDGVAPLPTIGMECYNVRSGEIVTETIAPENLKFETEDGVTLETRDGSLLFPAEMSGTIKVTAHYQHRDGKTYSTVLNVTLPNPKADGLLTVVVASNYDTVVNFGYAEHPEADVPGYFNLLFSGTPEDLLSQRGTDWNPYGMDWNKYWPTPSDNICYGNSFSVTLDPFFGQEYICVLPDEANPYSDSEPLPPGMPPMGVVSIYSDGKLLAEYPSPMNWSGGDWEIFRINEAGEFEFTNTIDRTKDSQVESTVITVNWENQPEPNPTLQLVPMLQIIDLEGNPATLSPDNTHVVMGDIEAVLEPYPDGCGANLLINGRYEKLVCTLESNNLMQNFQSIHIWINGGLVYESFMPPEKVSRWTVFEVDENGTVLTTDESSDYSFYYPYYRYLYIEESYDSEYRP